MQDMLAIFRSHNGFYGAGSDVDSSAYMSAIAFAKYALAWALLIWGKINWLWFLILFHRILFLITN